ncbi:MAG TPA: hypothetical protein PLN03_13610 [Spirochaetota bacterium]|nr:hypothetical protein [Spirochaetota bacterium]
MKLPKEEETEAKAPFRLSTAFLKTSEAFVAPFEASATSVILLTAAEVSAVTPTTTS